MQILHPFAGSIQQYAEAISDPDRYRPDHCPQCEAKQPLAGHGFYCRTLTDPVFDGVIRVRRYLCRLCKRTVSLLPEFALPWLWFSLTVISLFLVARLLRGLTLAAAALAARQPAMPYQRIDSATNWGVEKLLLDNSRLVLQTSRRIVAINVAQKKEQRT